VSEAPTQDVPFPNPGPQGYVVGLGTDIVEVDRIRKVVERSGEHFLKRVYTDVEIAYCSAKANPYPHYAARFSAKEAVSKAFGTGIGAELAWKSVGVVHGMRGEALVVLDEKGRALLAAAGADAVAITLSHTATYAQAVALLLRRG
jgi:holo-[acyl-carrier protein] synthase